MTKVTVVARSRDRVWKRRMSGSGTGTCQGSSSAGGRLRMRPLRLSSLKKQGGVCLEGFLALPLRERTFRPQLALFPVCHGPGSPLTTLRIFTASLFTPARLSKPPKVQQMFACSIHKYEVDYSDAAQVSHCEARLRRRGRTCEGLKGRRKLCRGGSEPL